MRNIIKAMPGIEVMFGYKVDGKYVCLRLGYRYKNSVYLYLSGYAPESARLSAMTGLVVDTFQWGIEHGLAMTNLSFGSDQSKTRWSPTEHIYLEAFFEGQGLVSKFAFPVYDKLKLSKKRKSLPQVDQASDETADAPANSSTLRSNTRFSLYALQLKSVQLETAQLFAKHSKAVMFVGMAIMLFVRRVLSALS
jgi:hypothetical protein